MRKKIITVYLVFCIVFFVAVLSLLGLRVKTNWDRNLSTVRDSFANLEQTSSELLGKFSNVDSGSFLEKIRKYLDREHRLLLMSIYSAETGMQYLYAKNQNYIDSPDQIEANWQGSPVYKRLPFGSAVLSLPLGKKAATNVDGLYTILGREDFFPIIKDAFIILFVFFIVTSIVLLITPIGQTGVRDGAEASRGAQRPDTSAEAKNLFSPNSGLGWNQHLQQRLKFEIDRAASLDLDLALALVRVDDFDSIAKQSAVYVKIAKMLLENYTFQDLAFEYKDDSYAIIIPDMDLDQGIMSLDHFKKKISSSAISDQPVTVSVGLSSRAGRLVNGATLLAESAKALKKAQAEGKNLLIAFRANPEKYRETVSKKV